jgi:hypothetical protein
MTLELTSSIMKLSRQGATWGMELKLRPQRSVQFVCVEGNLISVEVRNRKETPCVGSVRRIILSFEMSFWTPLLTVAVGSLETGCVFPVPGFLRHLTAVASLLRFLICLLRYRDILLHFGHSTNR